MADIVTNRIRALKARYMMTEDRLIKSKIIEEIELEFKHLEELYHTRFTIPTPLTDLNDLIWTDQDNN